MAGAFDQNWYRVAGLRPRLRPHAQTRRQRVRNHVWYVLQDGQTGRSFRVSSAAHALLAMMDGTRTVADMLARLSRFMGAERPSRGDVLQLMVQLHQSDLLVAPLPPDLAELDRRAQGQARRKLWSVLGNPLAIRVPLWDPDAALTRALPFVRALCCWPVLLLALLVTVTGGVMAAMHASELAGNVADRVFAADNVLMLALLYPLAKGLHEAGHCFAVKLGGGDVHEIGLMVLVLFPVPYVDASASAGFPDAWRRITVSAAGMAVELFLAGLASIAWVLLAPGPLRAAALDIMVLCGVSTLVFNGNPLLRFDGYYVLSDLIGVPNLDTRSRKQLGYVVRRYLLGMRGQRSSVEVPGEGRWLLGFGVASLLYRLVMVVSIGLIVATKLFAAGVALAALSVVQMLVLPVLRGVRFLLVGRDLAGRRRRAWLGAGGAGTLVVLGLFVLPIPHGLVAPGALTVPSEAIVRAGADGFVDRIAAADGTDVVAGQMLFVTADPVAAARADVLDAEVAVQRSRLAAVQGIDLVQARLIADQLARAEATAGRAREEVGALDIVSVRPGRFVVPDAASLPGRFVHKGDVLGYVLERGDIEVRAVVSQAELDLVRSQTVRTDVLLAERTDHTLPGRIIRETPSALDRAPAPALAPVGGGPMLADPTSPKHDRPLDRWYAFDIALPDADADAAAASRIGEHASVRFDLGRQPIAWRLVLWGQQLMLRTFGV